MYVDGFVLAVPTNKLNAYKKISMKAGEVWLDHGALEYRECFGDDMAAQFGVSFPKLVIAKRDETVVFSWIVYKNKAQRDAINKKVMADPRLAKQMDPKKMPFDVKRMSYGGFEMAVDMGAPKAAKKAAKAPAKKKAR